MQNNKYLIKEDSGIGEGIVIKRYDFVNKYGRTAWAKIVNEDFKNRKKENSLRKNENNSEFDLFSTVEWKIAKKFVTCSLCEKTYSKLRLEHNGWSCKMIPEMLNLVYYDLIREEIWEILKEFKNPIINFKLLRKSCDTRIKEIMSHLFN